MQENILRCFLLYRPSSMINSMRFMKDSGIQMKKEMRQFKHLKKSIMVNMVLLLRFISKVFMQEIISYKQVLIKKVLLLRMLKTLLRNLIKKCKQRLRLILLRLTRNGISLKKSLLLLRVLLKDLIKLGKSIA
jgi:hypothetical protein